MLKFQSKDFFHSATHALNGLRIANKSQRNFKKHLFISFFYIIMAVIFELEVTSICLIIFACAMTLSLELMNSCIEFIMDAYYKNKWAKLAKLAKDMSAGAVLISSCAALAITFLLCIEKIF